LSRPVLFLDESGDHNLFKVDPQYPVFVFGGCIMDLEYHDTVVTDQLNKLKIEFFGTKDVIIHTADIVRRRGVFRILTAESTRKKFFDAINSFMEELNYRIVSCVVRKTEHLRKYRLAAYDPYMLALKVVVERFCYYLNWDPWS